MAGLSLGALRNTDYGRDRGGKVFWNPLVPTVVDWQKATEIQKFLDTVFRCFFQADSASITEAVFYMEQQEI